MAKNYICSTTAGIVVQELSYTPWGQLRDPETLRPYAPDSLPEPLLGLSFTGHEHLNAFGLVNMNARLYDPAAGRFLSPDPYVQAPEIAKYAKGLKWASYGFTAVSAGVTSYNIYQDVTEGQFISAALRAGVFGLTIGANFIPIVGPAISTAIGLADTLYGEQFYNYMENRYTP